MSYIMTTATIINMPVKAQNPVIEELLCNYTYGTKWNVVYNTNDNCITIGNYTYSDYGNSEYVVNVTDDGVYIGGSDYSAAMRGFLTFLEKIKYAENDNYFYIENCCLTDSPLIKFRCVHLCVFPETKLDFLKKCVRSCGIAKYSHIILEFWGMLQFDCMKELSWPFAYGKDDIRKITKEANALGMEVIPMFNHLGHAAACRELNGKHVVLDQNPSYEYLFDIYGWAWNIKRNDVYELLRKVRDELIEVCGEGNYFHIGCDEAYYGKSVDKAYEMAEYINKVSKDLKSKGRRAIIWQDMLLSKDNYDKSEMYVALSCEDVAKVLMENIDKDILIADWQYWCANEIWKSSQELKENGFEVVCCPWDTEKIINNAVKTVTSQNLFGMIHTTWHTLYNGFREMIYAGVLSYGTNEENLEDIRRFYCASVARRALPSQGNYEKCGWTEQMTGSVFN